LLIVLVVELVSDKSVQYSMNMSRSNNEVGHY